MREKDLKVYIWRHSKRQSSWSRFDEPHVCRENYLAAQVVVLARSEPEALALCAATGRWDPDELGLLRPEVVALDGPRVLVEHVEPL